MIGVAVQQLPLVVLFPEHMGDTKRHRHRRRLTGDEHLAALDGHGIGEIAADREGEPFDLQDRTARPELRTPFSTSL